MRVRVLQHGQIKTTNRQSEVKSQTQLHSGKSSATIFVRQTLIVRLCVLRK